MTERHRGRAELAREIRSAAGYRPDPDRSPVELRLPFEGRWLTVRTPAERVPSHGTHLGGQTFALDFVGVGPDRRTASRRDWRTWVATERADRFVGFGRPVLAPARGRVVAVQDGEPDHAARRSPLVLVPYGATQGARLRQGITAVTGNHVVLALEDQSGFVLLAHLRRGSLAVSPGTRLEVGDPVGACGNSGNSTQPHLHVQAMDSATLIGARGLPVVFLDYQVLPSGRTGPRSVSRGVPGRHEVVETRRLPVR
jgi:murein DD-endopeptidase MepM/ murein hydrolase activator NlpD